MTSIKNQRPENFVQGKNYHHHHQQQQQQQQSSRRRIPRILLPLIALTIIAIFNIYYYPSFFSTQKSFTFLSSPYDSFHHEIRPSTTLIDPLSKNYLQPNNNSGVAPQQKGQKSKKRSSRGGRKRKINPRGSKDEKVAMLENNASLWKNNVVINEKTENVIVKTMNNIGVNEDGTCNIFSGEWVPNPRGPYYTNKTCWAIQQHQNCLQFGRPDKGFMKWRWKPYACELPIFDPVRFLELVRGKSLAFVGDSVARNHMQSLICLLSRVVYPDDVSDTTDENFKKWEYRTYDFNISIFWSPYLVKTERTDPKDITKPFKLYLDEYDESWTTQIESFNYVIISAGHWFFRPTMFYVKQKLIGCLYCPQTNITRKTSYFSYRRAFRTAFRAINELKNFKGVTFLRSFAPSHFEGGPWDKGGDCPRKRPFRRNEIVLEDFSLEMYNIQLSEIKIAQRFGRRTGVKFRLMDMTQAMLLRPDGHPSKYGHWPQENVILANDCVHWCLPGPIDTWNDFLLHMMRKEEGYRKYNRRH